ncbi:MAG: RIP metalloprotease RseP [Epsilonproteobacteria bacterium]|nr:RIP metalloprotease RseP [Campylobacterota bacterium]
MGILVALLVLSVLIFFHELGHFTAARFFGVQVDVFSIGFGKKLYSRMIGKTEWSISAIPLGGYVKMKGQDDSDPTKVSYDEDSYNVKKPWQRIIILLAGPFANFLMAFFLYFAVSQMGTYATPIFNYTKYLPATVGDFSKDSEAKKVGIQKGDTIIQINHTPITNWGELGEVTQKVSTPIIITLLRGEQTLTYTMQPIVKELENKFGEKVKRKLIGISPKLTEEKFSFSLREGIVFAWNETLYASNLIFQSVEKMLTGAVGADKVGGIITIVDITSQASNAGIVMLFLFTALISVNLGVLNLLPIPALDGGHIMFNLYEMITGKTASEKAMMYITMVGWALLLALMMLGLYNDVTRIWGTH